MGKQSKTIKIMHSIPPKQQLVSLEIELPQKLQSLGSHEQSLSFRLEE